MENILLIINIILAILLVGFVLFQKSEGRFNRSCPLSLKNAPIIDYKNIKVLKKFISENGKIIPSRVSSVSFKKQKLLSRAIKRARFLGLMSYTEKYTTQ